MLDKVFVAKVGDIAPGKFRRIKAGHFDIAVFNIDGKFYAIKDSCPHLGEPLSRGTLEGSLLTCPGHSWKFDVKTGACMKGDEQLSLRTFDTIVDGESLYVVLNTTT